MQQRIRTLFDKIWESHVVDRQPDGTCLLYVDRHFVHEVTSLLKPSRGCASKVTKCAVRT